MEDNLGDRMKSNYEDRSRYSLTRRTPVIIRVDGRAFHTLTKKMKKPFDLDLIKVMQDATYLTAENIQGCKLAYVQSDEVSFLLTDYEKLVSEAWFDYNLQKITTITASIMSVYFNDCFKERFGILPFSVFDARAFNIPKEEVSNYFLWRARDWHRNSINMYAREFFTNKELQNLNTYTIQCLLAGEGHPWGDISDVEKHATFVYEDPHWEEKYFADTLIAIGGKWVNWKFDSTISPTFQNIDTLISKYVNLDSSK